MREWLKPGIRKNKLGSSLGVDSGNQREWTVEIRGSGGSGQWNSEVVMKKKGEGR